MASKYIRNITKILKASSGVLFGRKTAGTGRGEELTPADARTLISVYSTSEVDAIIGGISGLTSADIDTLAEINAILTDADLASVSYVDSGLSGKQATLVSGTNIKTVNSTSLLGSGDIVVSASPAGSSGQMQFNSAGSFGGANAVVYAATGTHVAITSQGSSTIPLCIKGAASQSANLNEWQNSDGTNLTVVDSSGNIKTTAGIFCNSGTITSTHSGLTASYPYTILWANNVAAISFGRDASKVAATHVWQFSNTGYNYNTTADTGWARNAAGVIEINNGTAGTFRDLIVRNFRMASPTLVPASASATGSAGQIAWDADYIYVCTATNTWKRVAIATW